MKVIAGTRIGRPLFGRYTVDLLFEPRDAWIGAFWDRNEAARFLYVCVVPFFPVRFVANNTGSEKNSEEEDQWDE